MNIYIPNYSLISCIKERVFMVQRMCGEKNKYVYFSNPLSITSTDFKDDYGISAVQYIKRK